MPSQTTLVRRTNRSSTRGSGWRLHGLVGLVVAGLVGACAAQPKGVAADSLAAEAALLARIEAEVGDAACSSDAQCRTLPIGAKACGGPARWLAWSTATARPAQLAAWSDELAALQRRRFAASGMMSTCSIVPEPGTACLAGRCRLSAPASSR